MIRALSFALVLFICTDETGACQKNKAELVEDLVSNLHQKHLFNGAIVIGENGKIFFSKGYGYATFQDSIRFSPSTSSDGGSNAKTLTAACILLLAEQGKLKLDNPVEHYLPGYPYPNTSVRNLITHSTGGLPDYDYFFENAADTEVVTTALNLRIINSNKPALEYPPNTNFYYDNAAFDLAALVVERVTGTSYYQFLRDHIFDRLHMDSSFVRPARFKDWKPGRTVGYHYQNDSLQLNDIADREGFYGGCNIWFTATDLYRWGESFYQNKIFSDSLIQTIMSPVLISGKRSHVNFGAWYTGKSKDACYYWGNVAGFYSWVYWDMKKHFTIAFMTNTDMPQWVRPLFTSALIDIMEGVDYTPLIEPPSDSIDRENLQQIAGNYEIENIGKVQIVVRGSKKILKLNDGMEYRLHVVDKKTFYIPGFDPWISFETLKNDKFQKIYWSSTILQTTGKHISD